jgi:hypothetical protein
MIGDLLVLAGAVLVVAVGGYAIGRMIARRIDRWQVRAEEQAAEAPAANRDPAGKERVDDPDSA